MRLVQALLFALTLCTTIPTAALADGALARAERSTGWGEAVRRNREDARRAALRTCENHNHGQCRILVMDCTE